MERKYKPRPEYNIHNSDDDRNDRTQTTETKKSKIQAKERKMLAAKHEDLGLTPRLIQ